MSSREGSTSRVADYIAQKLFGSSSYSEEQCPAVFFFMVFETLPLLFATHVFPRLPPATQCALCKTCRYARMSMRQHVSHLLLELPNGMPRQELATIFPAVRTLTLQVHSTEHENPIPRLLTISSQILDHITSLHFDCQGALWAPSIANLLNRARNLCHFCMTEEGMLVEYEGRSSAPPAPVPSSSTPSPIPLPPAPEATPSSTAPAPLVDAASLFSRSPSLLFSPAALLQMTHLSINDDQQVFQMMLEMDMRQVAAIMESRVCFSSLRSLEITGETSSATSLLLRACKNCSTLTRLRYVGKEEEPFWPQPPPCEEETARVLKWSGKITSLVDLDLEVPDEGSWQDLRGLTRLERLRITGDWKRAEFDWVNGLTNLTSLDVHLENDYLSTVNWPAIVEAGKLRELSVNAVEEYDSANVYTNLTVCDVQYLDDM